MVEAMVDVVEVNLLTEFVTAVATVPHAANQSGVPVWFILTRPTLLE
jgi:hypothetical protein